LPSPTAEGRADYASEGFREARPRHGGAPGGRRTLAAMRLKRALQRQWLAFVIVALPVAAAAAVYFWAGGMAASLAAAAGPGAGMGAGLLVAAVRELNRNTVTSLSSLGNHRGYAILGAAPELSQRTLRELPPDKRSPLGCLAFQPASPFATAFRDLQSRLPERSLVAFIGSFPNEGATTSALCAAASAAQQGRSAIVVDCDLRRRSLTRIFESEPGAGVLEACKRPEDWRDFIEEEEETGVHFLPAARASTAWASLNSTPGFPLLLDELRNAYDLVVLDCPPALSSADGPTVARRAEKCVVVTAWDETPISAIRAAVRSLKGRASTGVYVNRVPPGYRFGRLRPD